mgnify:CR=1 FL=1
MTSLIIIVIEISMGCSELLGLAQENIDLDLQVAHLHITKNIKPTRMNNDKEDNQCIKDVNTSNIQKAVGLHPTLIVRCLRHGLRL